MATFSHFSGDNRDSVSSNGFSAFPQGAEIIEIDDDSDEVVKDKRTNLYDEDDEMSEATDENDEEGEDEGEEGSYDEEMDYENGEEEEIEDDEDDNEDEESEDEEGSDSLSEGEDEIEDITDDYDATTNGTRSVEAQRPGFGSLQEDPAPRASSLLSASLLNSDVQQTLHPLQDMAERVLKQIESFAHNLDQFRRQSPTPQDPKTFQDVCKLVRSYQSVAERNAHDVSKSTTARRPHRLVTRDSEKQSSTSEVDEQVIRWHLEAETWDLLYQVLSIADPETRERSYRYQGTALQTLHRYSSDQEVWDEFLKADHFARESVMVLQWLEKWALSTIDVDGLISDLEKEADRGQGLWAHGWLYTKETIKGAKRLRSWPRPLDPENSRITPSLLGSEKQTPLITQLDPDAVTRQGLGLQQQDRAYEQAAWLNIWKMLRTGRSLNEIRAWSQERLESWRGISISGSNVDSTSKNGDSTNSLVRMMSCRSQESWRSACSVLANNSLGDPYEKAVYALLCGETEAAYKVCQSWTDYVYVYYNHIILSRYSDFCKQFLRKLDLPPGQKPSVTIESPKYESILHFLDNLTNEERVSEEAQSPFRQIQAAILARGFDDFFYYCANAPSKLTDATNEPVLLPTSPMVTVDDPVLTAAIDETSVRIIAHLYLLLGRLGFVRGDSHFTETVALNVVKYIEFLREREKIDLIPLYTSMLPKDMGDVILGKIMINVVGETERQSFIQRMRGFGIDVSAVLDSQWQWALSEARPDELQPIPIAGKFYSLKEKLGTVSGVGVNIVGRILSPEQERLIRCLEWRSLISTEWPTLCSHAAYLYKRFFRHVELAAARALWERIQFSKKMMPPEFSLMPFMTESDADADASRAREITPASPAKSARSMSPLKSAGGHRRQRSSVNPNKTTAEQLVAQARIVEDLEQLASTFDALEQWGNLCGEYVLLPNQQQKKAFHHQLQASIDAFTENVNPLCQDWLSQSTNEDEATELEMIRTAYLPEVVLLYHKSLYFAGCTIGREVLAQCMTLAIAVAGSPVMTECFVSAKRMRELVTALATSSAAILAIEDTKLKKKLPRNATLDIWKIKANEEESAGLTLTWPKGSY